MKITEMKGASLLPKKIYAHDIRLCLPPDERKYNEAVTQLEQCSVEVDCEELAKDLAKQDFNANWESYIEEAKSLSKCKQNWLRLERNENDSVTKAN